MREKNNIQMVCKDCAEKQKNFTQDILTKHPLQIGDFVKIAVGSGKTIEHMWFKVLEISENRFYGVLDNYPCYEQEMTMGDKFWFDCNQIEDIIRRHTFVRR